MKRLLMALAVTCLLPSLADANAISVPGGGSYLWTYVDGPDGSWEEPVAVQTGVSYDVVLDMEKGLYGLSFLSRVAGSEETSILTAWGVEYWRIEPGVEWFVGGQLVNWDEVIAGEQKFLGGGRAGVRFDVGEAPFELSGAYSVGSHVKQAEIFFGLRLSHELGQGE